jgi:hypothetical protein
MGKKKVKARITAGLFWLPELGSNPGPADYC